MSDEDDLTGEELAAMEARAAAATPGPWQAFMYVEHAMADGPVPAPPEELDFIAAARQDIPRLVAEIRHLRQGRPTAD